MHLVPCCHPKILLHGNARAYFLFLRQGYSHEIPVKLFRRKVNITFLRNKLYVIVS